MHYKEIKIFFCPWKTFAPKDYNMNLGPVIAG